MNSVVMKYLVYTLFVCFSMVSCNDSDDNQYAKVHKLWYETPAKEWMQSLPTGNGRLGVTNFGGVETEIITLNEISMWSGQYDGNMHRPAGKKVLEEIHKAFFQKDLEKVNQLATGHLAGNGNSFGSHVPLGNMKIDFLYPEGDVTSYKRSLDLKSAISSVTFEKAGVKYNREYFCSNPDDVFILKLSVDKPHSLTFNLSFDMYRESDFMQKDDGVEFLGTVKFHEPGGVSYHGKVGLKLKDGTMHLSETGLSVKDATDVVLAFDVRTNYSNQAYTEEAIKTVENVLNKDFTEVREQHIADHSELYSRAEIYLGDNTNQQDIATNTRWNNVKGGGNDVVLDALLFNYARYLLIAASRENSPLPANLQGVWNDNLACNMGWTNDYHLDINTQQNYWLANLGNLHELNKPLFKYIEHLAEYGSHTAKDVYGAKGWTAHTIANVWGYTACGGDVNWGLFPLASSWIATHLWTQYEYTLDKEFLEKQAYPLLKSNAEFILDFFMIDPETGYLIGGPSTSPENTFMYNNHHLSISMGTTADRQLAYEIFNSCIEASKILGIDEDFRAILEDQILKLSPMLVGKRGSLQEWYLDFDEANSNHRHTTHLLGLYPFNQISREQTPELVKAAEKTIELRLLAEGWEDVEWSRANMICLYARLLNAEKAYESLVQLQRVFTRENLLTISPEGIAGAPYDIFVFDGNEAAGAGIAEMLIQTQEGYIDFIPALPQAWKDGFFKGLSIKGGADIDLKWQKGKIKFAKLTCTATNEFTIKIGSSLPQIQLNGKLVAPIVENGLAKFRFNKKDILELKY